MLHAVLKILATCCTDTPPAIEDSQDTIPVNQLKYQQIVGCLIHFLMVRSEIQFAVIMAATHKANPHKVTSSSSSASSPTLRVPPTSAPLSIAILLAKCDAAFCIHPKTGGSEFSVSFSVRQTSAPFHTIIQVQSTKIYYRRVYQVLLTLHGLDRIP
jgi:hypothetical protein